MSDFKLVNLTYHSDNTPYYRKLLDLPGFVLLQSTDKVRGRYDILSACPYDKVKHYKNTADLINPFSDLQGKLIPHSLGLDLPFQGGAIGFFSYDFACALAEIETRCQPKLQVLPQVDIGLYDWAIITDHVLKKVTLFSANTQSETPAVVEKALAKWHGLEVTPSNFTVDNLFNPLISKKEYEEAFYAIQTDLKRGRCYQVNFTQPFQSNYKGCLWSIYKKISAYNPVPFAAFMHTDEATLLSFSPERFIQMDNNKLLTSPIKGTERRVSDERQDEELRIKLQNCSKNRAENVMIVDLMRNDFGKIAKPGSIFVSALCDVESFSSVHHLVSHIHGERSNNTSPLDVFRACFPGGSITGAPKLESMHVISELERYARGIYCGNIGYFSNHGRFDTNIAIRTITAMDSILHLSAGGAIVMDSIFEEEYQECFTKIAGILKGLF